MKLVSLFAGIGGFDLAADAVEWETAVTCEINPFGRKVLTHYWPDAYHHDDIHTLTGEIIHEKIKARFGSVADDIVLVGGFPCQPYSNAGKRLGKADERHLWPEMLRVIRETQPKYVVGENVSGIVSWNGGMVFEEVQAEMEAEGYEVQPFVLPACAVNAPHRRDRVWFVAHRIGEKQRKQTIGGLRAESWDGTRLATNAHNNGSHGPEIRQGLESGNDGDTQGKDKAGKSARRTGKNAEFAADTKGRRFGGLQNEGETARSRESGQTFGFLRGVLHAPNASIQQLQGRKLNGSLGSKRPIESEGRQFGGSIRGQWENFPTQPPICSRNDGLSSRLAGITVSKHRNESIKAYGNAIVPQVAIQIFRAIIETEEKLK